MKEEIMKLTIEFSNNDLNNLLLDVIDEIEGGSRDE